MFGLVVSRVDDEVLEEELDGTVGYEEEVELIQRIVDIDALHRQVTFNRHSFRNIVSDRRSEHAVKWQVVQSAHNCLNRDVIGLQACLIGHSDAICRGMMTSRITRVTL